MRGGLHRMASPPVERSAGPGLADRVLARCARVTSSGLLIPEIDGMRFFAIASVIAYHVSVRMPHSNALSPDLGILALLSGAITFAFDKGFFGVQMFFAISGFILSLPFASHYLLGRRKPSVARYYIRRVTRLEPPYLISLAVCFLILVFVMHQEAGALLPHLGASATYLHHILYGRQSAINGVLWSLECEVQFYILAPVLALVYRVPNTRVRRAAIFLIPIGVYAVARLVKETWLYAGAHGYTSLHATLAMPALALERVLIIKCLSFFCAGFLLSDLFLVSWQTKPRKHWRWDVVGVCSALVLTAAVQAMPSEKEVVVGNLIAYPVLILLCYVAAFRGAITNRVLRNRWIATTGGMCYSIYLYHEFIIRMGLPTTRPFTGSIPLQVMFYGLLCIAICGVFFVLCEKPFMYSDWPARASAWVHGRRRPLRRLVAQPTEDTDGVERQTTKGQSPQ